MTGNLGKRKNNIGSILPKQTGVGNKLGKHIKMIQLFSERVKERGYDRAGEKCQEQ